MNKLSNDRIRNEYNKFDETANEKVAVRVLKSKKYKSVYYFDGDDIYICSALIGDLITDNVWTITKYEDKITEIIETQADGAEVYTHAATDLATVKAYTYS